MGPRADILWSRLDGTEAIGHSPRLVFPEDSMRQLKLLIGWTLAATCGCSSMNHTERGALTGGVLGGAGGAVIGGLAGHPGAGAAIGAGSGALLGGLIGNHEDRAERRAAEWVARHQLTINDVVQMSQRQVGDDLIINQINTSGSVFHLTGQDVIYLREQGVNERVIGAMQAARGPIVIGGRYVRPPGHVVIVEPPPPPPVSVGFGIGYNVGPHRHCW
jgi:hypothetical protein